MFVNSKVEIFEINEKSVKKVFSLIKHHYLVEFLREGMDEEVIWNNSSTKKKSMPKITRYCTCHKLKTLEFENT